MTENSISINKKSLIKDMEAINSNTATPGNGSTRFSYSEEDRKTREYLSREFKNLNLEVKTDGAGNIRAKYNPKENDLPSVMIGSHIDTVMNGGEFDGLAGTIAALEVIRTIKENKTDITHPVELVIFSEEEGSNFGSTTVGSKVMTGKLTKEDLMTLYNSEKQPAYEVMKGSGFDADSIGEDLLQKDEVKAMMELHIEQGGVLEEESKSVGIVHAIAGMNTFQVTLNGVSNHAGTTPMPGRKDPLVGASKVIIALEEYARTQVNNTTVATVGKLECNPSGSNVINKTVTFNVDIRDIEQSGIDQVSNYLKDKVKETAERQQLEYEIDLIGTSAPARLSKTVIDTLVSKAENREMDYLKLHSGAVHDTMMLADVADVAMIFVPSKNGISHSPDEYTSYEDIEDGANLMLEAVIELAQ